MVNYFNRYILVYCRHNHDIKCILSGKAAKAAMFYITDYITKMDLKTYEMLSLLSRAVGSLPVEPELPPRQRARTLLHKCLAQFSRQQQIHAQQAARYTRGHNDSISSHDSTPMMSGLLIYFVRKQYNIATHDDTSNMMDEDVEQPYLRIQTDQHGTLVCKNQVTDYWYRPPALADMTFYEFAHCVSLENENKNKNKKTDGNHLNAHARHMLHDNHPLHSTHQLVEHTNEKRGECQTRLIPRVVGSYIPHEKTGCQWQLFVLAHFKPFSHSAPLLANNESLEDAFKSFAFSHQSLFQMNNWESVHECQDECDAERLHKRTALTAESMAMTQALSKILNSIDSKDVDVVPGRKMSSKTESDVQQAVQLLEQSQWISCTRHCTDVLSCITSTSEMIDLPNPTPQLLKKWKLAIKEQECIVAHNRQNAQEKSELHIPSNSIADTELLTEAKFSPMAKPMECAPTDVPKASQSLVSVEDIINDIGARFNMNERQWIAFRIIA
jgi:hypothetical protein